MAVKRMRLDAQAVAQVDTATPSGVSAGRTFTLQINGKTIETVASSTTLSLLTSTLASLVNASSIPEFQELTATDITTALQLAAKTAGKPFTLTGSAAGGGTLSLSSASGQGPSDVSVASNYIASGVPASGDSLFLENADVDLSWNLNQPSLTLNMINVDASSTGAVGLPDYSGASGTGYFEYRPKYWAISANTLNIGLGDGSGAGRVRMDLGANATSIFIFSTGQSLDAGLPAVQIKGSAAAYTLVITQGSAGFALFEGEVANLPVVRIGSESSPATDVQLIFGMGSTLGLIQQFGGQIDTRAGIGTLTLRQGETTLWYGSIGTADLTPANGATSTLFWRSGGTLGPTIIGAGGVLDCSQSPLPKTAYNVRVSKGAKIYDPYGTVTWINGIALQNCGLPDVDLDLGSNFTLSKN